MNKINVMVFYINKILCGAQSLEIKEIISYREPKKIESIQNHIEGEIDFRGQMIEVISLTKFFNEKKQSEIEEKKILIVELEGRVVGFLIDGIVGIIPMNTNDLEVLPQIVTKKTGNFIKGVTIHEDKIINIIDLNSIANYEYE